MTKGSVKMTEKEINHLLDIGYTMAQVSQLIKLQSDGFPVSIASDLEKARNLMVKDNDDYRIFRQNIKRFGLINLNARQRETFFNAFIDNLQYQLPIDAGMNLTNSTYIIDVMKENQEKNLGIDISPMISSEHTMELLKQLWSDLRDGVDVNVYLKSELPSKRKILLREALLRGVNIEKDLIAFSFLTSDDIPQLKTMIAEGYDYFSILKKFKNTNITLYLCEFKEENGIDPLQFVNNKMPLSVIKRLCELTLEGKDVACLKSMPITNPENIALLLKIKEFGFPLSKCKAWGCNGLQNILSGLDMGLTHEQIDKMLMSKFHPTMALILDCYSFEQPEYIDFLNESESIFLIDYYTKFRLLLEHNYNHKDNVYDIKELLFKDGKPVSVEEFEYYTELICKTNIEKTLLKTLKDGGYSLSQSKIIVQAKQDGLDISCMMDNRLTYEHLKAIRTCMELGLSIKKEKEYDLPELKKTEKKEYSKMYKYYYDDDEGNKCIYISY